MFHFFNEVDVVFVEMGEEDLVFFILAVLVKKGGEGFAAGVDVQAGVRLNLCGCGALPDIPNYKKREIIGSNELGEKKDKEY